MEKKQRNESHCKEQEKRLGKANKFFWLILLDINLKALTTKTEILE